MTILKHELKRGKLALLIWTAAISSMLALCVFIYPEMAKQMGDINSLFANMGGFSQAFGMDKLNFGEFIGFFCVECGNILGLGGAFFAALFGISALAKEEKEHTAEFLLTHPIQRTEIIAEKLCAVFLQILLLNAVALLVSVFSALLVGEEINTKPFLLLFLAYLLMQVEIAAVTFGISAFLSRGSLGIGLGLSAVFYFLNIISNLSEDAKFLKYITPFGYTDGADIVSNQAIDMKYLSVGLAFAVIGVLLAFWKYRAKDIR